MTRNWRLLSTGGIGALLLASSLAQSADLLPAVVTNLTGTLRIQQGIPCDDDVDQTTPVNGGFIQFTPAEGIPAAGGARAFTLSRVNVSFAPFSVSRSCLGFGETRNYTDIRANLARAVTFLGLPTATPGVFSVTIPKDQFELYYSARVNGGIESGYKHPKEDVTGTINLAGATAQMRVVLGQSIHFKFGCDPIFDICVIDTTKEGTLTVNMSGTIVFPDSDGDGVADRSDNCKYTANPDQSPVATPKITPPPSLTLASCLSRDFGLASAADVCDATPVKVTNNAPAQFTVGANVVTWTAVDGLSRTASATQTVTVVDTTPPQFTFVPLDIFMNDCGPANLGQPTATDDCAGAVSFSNNAPPKFYVGVTPVTWTASDLAGNTATATQKVTVVDLVPPTVYCVPTTPNSPTGTSFRVSAIDSCTANPVIKIGSYVLKDGEIIMINETGQPGIRLHNDISKEGYRQFHVGKGEAVITAVDESGNVGSVVCSIPR